MVLLLMVVLVMVVFGGSCVGAVGMLAVVMLVNCVGSGGGSCCWLWCFFCFCFFFVFCVSVLFY